MIKTHLYEPIQYLEDVISNQVEDFISYNLATISYLSLMYLKKFNSSVSNKYCLDHFMACYVVSALAWTLRLLYPKLNFYEFLCLPIMGHSIMHFKEQRF